MAEILLGLDKRAQETMAMLREHYQISNARVIRKAVTLLRIAREVELSNGKIIIRNGDKESELIVR